MAARLPKLMAAQTVYTRERIEYIIMRKIGVLFLMHNFCIGGVQKSNISMIKGLDKDKFRVHVLYINGGTLLQEIFNEDIEIQRLGNTYNLKAIINILYVFRIIKYVKNNSIDVIHSMDSLLYVLGSTAAFFSRISHVRTQPNFIRKHERKNAKTLKLTPFERWTDFYITYNNATKKDLCMAGVNIDKINTILSLTSLEELTNEPVTSDIRKEFEIKPNTKIVCSMSRLVKNKGIEIFIEMIPYIINEYSDVVFLITGDGVLKGSLMDRCRELDIGDKVIFSGFRTDRFNIGKQITLGVYPTSDTAGMVTIPQCGKVLISRDSEIMSEYVIDGQTGYLVKNDNPEEYAECVLRLLQDEVLLKTMEEKTVSYYQSEFDGEKNMRKLEGWIEKLVKKKVVF